MSNININGKVVRAEILSNLAVIKMRGYRVRHIANGDWLGNDLVFDSKEHASRFAWNIQERLNFNCQDKYSFAKANPGLTYDQYCVIAAEEFERCKI